MKIIKSILKTLNMDVPARRAIDSLLARIPLSSVMAANTQSILQKKYQNGGIHTIYDIGANNGEWASSVSKLMPSARLVLFEANPQHCAALKATGFDHHMDALSKPGVSEVRFYTAENSGNSTGASYYKEVTELYDVSREIVLPTKTLDELIKAKKLPLPDLIKIDTQGSELDIMMGGVDAFRAAKLVLMEMPVLEYNRGAPSFDQYLDAMRKFNFVPSEVLEVHHFGSVVAQIDMLFVSKSCIEAPTIKNLHL